MAESSWRPIARRVIQRVIAEVGRDDEARLRKAISAAYPFGDRKHYPYKIWLDEVQRQLHPERFVHRAYTKRGGLVELPPENQGALM